MVFPNVSLFLLEPLNDCIHAEQRSSLCFHLYFINMVGQFNKLFLSVPKEIIVDANSKEKILEELEAIGISKATLFPEMDNVLKCIKKKYDK